MIQICGRKVKIVNGKKSQTINICTHKNIQGQYDYKIRISPSSVSESDLMDHNFKSIEELVGCLQNEHAGTLEISVGRETKFNLDREESGSKKNPLNSSLINISAPLSWIKEAKLEIEKSIDQLIREFIKHPYLHRCEHSLHCDLYKSLTEKRIFNGKHPLKSTTTQLVHKEWPETELRPGKTKRGNFDFGILSPYSLPSCSNLDFWNGYIKPAFVIEIGLNYNLRGHLSPDSDKLDNSKVDNGYLIHLVRPEKDTDKNNSQTVENFILQCKWKTAYVRVTESKTHYKFVNDSKISTT
jgi:hypothetical protein